MRKISICFFWIFLASGLCAKDWISVNAVGDIMMGSLYPHKVLPPQNGRIIFQDALKYLKAENPDILLGNLEGALTHYNRSSKNIGNGRYFAFQMPPSYVKYLKEAGFNVLSTANNHAFDFGYQGYKDTRKYLAEAGIYAVGNKNEILTLTIKNRKVAVIGFAWFDFFNNILDSNHSRQIIRKAAQNHDIVIITFHGGTEGERALRIKNEMEYFFSSRRGNLIQFSRMAIDNGADLVIGHGPHVPRAMEIYKDRLIAYSLGNFVTYGMFVTTGARKYAPILNVKMDPEGKFIAGRIIPMIQHEDWPLKGLPRYDKKARAVSLIQQLSRLDFKNNPLHIDAHGNITVK